MVASKKQPTGGDMDDYWAKPPRPREQIVMFAPSLDDLIANDHAVRHLDSVLRGVDWTAWEARYHGHRGQPPIHPRLVAGAILYGLIHGIRSSRKLEDATRNRIDFMWFLDGMTIDHSTFAAFRMTFCEELKSLFRQISFVAVQRSMTTLIEVALDGTRVRAWSARDGSRTGQGLEKLMQEAEAKITKALDEMASCDIADDPALGTKEEIEKQLARAVQERERLEEALQAANERDEKRRGNGRGGRAVRVPVNDPESHVLPNKEGGYAPNHTPTVAVDKDSGLIVDADVMDGDNEADCVVAAKEEIKETYGVCPERMSFDGNLAKGENLADLEKEGIEAFTKVDVLPAEVVTTDRPDLSKPVREDLLERLPYRGKDKTLHRSAFVYDEDQDCYWCPMGRRLDCYRERTRHEGRIRQRLYRCTNCTGCPLAARCLSRKAKQRTLIRDEHEHRRERIARRMNTEQGKEVYRRRAPLAETPFAYIKGVLGIRQFFVCGLEKVRTEWRWICTAYNLRKLLVMRQGTTLPSPV
jgi:transposase